MTGIRQVDGKAAPVTGYALHFQPATVGLNQVAGNRESEAEALRKTPVSFAPVEGVEDSLLLLGSDARPSVTHLDP